MYIIVPFLFSASDTRRKVNRIALLSTLYLTVSEIIIPSLKSRENFPKVTKLLKE